MSLVEWLTNPANVIAAAQLLAAVVTAAATYALWRATKVLANETKVLSAMTARPFVIFSFRSSQAAAQALDAIVSNTGNATAFDVKVRITPALPNAHGSRQEGVTDTAYNIALLPPGAVLPRQGVMSRNVSEDNYKVHISWSLAPASASRETVEYEVRPNDGFRAGWSSKGAHQIAEELEKIRQAIPK